jgi:5-formyltetrahydrofolate cyclo-ligase
METCTNPVEKAEIRKAAKARLAALSPEVFTAAGAAAARHLPLIPRWDSFRSVLIFFSMKGEIDTRPIMETTLTTGKSFFAPRIEGEALVFYRIDRGSLTEPRGYREPEANPALALRPEDFPVLVLCPGLAFDRRLNRLGRGRGYYDRFFDSLNTAGRQYSPLGLCMDCQLADQVPIGSQDKKMDAILTESGIRCAGFRLP